MTSADTTDKPFRIDKRLVYEAYKAVKSNGGAAGVDGQTIEQFEADLKGNLYKIWNGMSSGSYFPPPVRAVPIPKKTGGQRILGVPTVSDRIAQMVVKRLIEPELDQIFRPDSYGYRPGKSALDAVGITRQRCWKYDWVLEFDIKGLNDNLAHDLLLKAVHKHVKGQGALLYIERWLTAPLEQDGQRIGRIAVPRKGVWSVRFFQICSCTTHLISNRTYPDLPWCRYADDGLVHCRTEQEAEAVKAALQARLAECQLEMHPTKTKIGYCKDPKRRGTYPNVSFDFLGYCFRPRVVRNPQNGRLFCRFTPGVAPSALNHMRATIRDLKLRQKTHVSLADIAREINPLLRGWIAYYGRFTPSALDALRRYVNQTLCVWVRRKFKRYARSTQAGKFLQRLAQSRTKLFVHWQLGITGKFV
ncbi:MULTISPECIES: group II intron reverse transcriptase/maturase [Rhizobium]|uniref:Group II intron reverse transcriptase/maturase n=3 Tax=Rhizobium TaxID=379 RepID=A0A6P1CGP7_RHITR|nr:MULTISPECIES: group II intron reverse transcriptase/maturase [Rhizobium]AGB73648.1 reverse transcriptase/maturase [Rhizobium tropici CIAT 899]ENN83932.1 reverse transcriptase/maturase [Rhizobium freirei PRF 81]MBB4245521.1 group II intron reverse transcriptase/maturase [Rhizobium tropici]MBB5596811.1 group II intron reverse transcriptase/maturase [Rhizobium tropici]MBB6489537.1 group II intron reverse transcriptase/maturase [Rhizobium lusitanum]